MFLRCGEHKKNMKHKVMVVEDTPEIRELLDVILKQAGYDTILNGDAAELKESFSGAECSAPRA